MYRDENGKLVSTQTIKARGFPYSKRTLYVHPDLHTALKARAVQAGVTLEALTEQALTEFLTARKSDILDSASEHDG